MNPTAEIETQLADLRSIYDGIQVLLARRADLQTVEQARTVFEQLVVAETNALDGLLRRREALEVELRRRAQVAEPVAPFDPPAPIRPAVHAALRPAVPVRPPRPQETPPGKARRQLKILVNRFAYAWRLDDALRGRINGIVDDRERPLGEALALLPWSVFAEPTSSQEVRTAHQERLLAWASALGEYQTRLAAEVEMLLVRYRGWLGIWELWRQNTNMPDGGARWLAFVADKKRALEGDAQQARQAIADLERQLAREAGRP